MKLLLLWLMLIPGLIYYSKTKDIIVRKGIKKQYFNGAVFRHYKTKNSGWIWIEKRYRVIKGDSVIVVNN